MESILKNIYWIFIGFVMGGGVQLLRVLTPRTNVLEIFINCGLLSIGIYIGMKRQVACFFLLIIGYYLGIYIAKQFGIIVPFP